MTELNRNKIFSNAKQWILEAGKIIREKINDPLIVDTKSNANDLVTTMDKETEKFFVNKIKSEYPDHLLLSEEGFGDDVKSLDGTVWIVDPIDGTMNFVHQKRNFAISIGIYHDGVGEVGFIYNVMDDVLYSAIKGEGAYKNGAKIPNLEEHIEFNNAIIGLNHFWLCENRLVDEKVMQQLVRTVRGTRTYGSAALEFAYVAEGIIDGYLTMRLSPWDIAAGIIIVNEVGGVTTNVSGENVNMVETNSILVCHPSIQETIIKDYIVKGKK
ncbi:inositol monophosphatase family protein [Virgibacillus necropolis]|uniref:inositol-phosphate phosphatase n=1 Tax=Virgibacillus necropolis TaxID=163877 RepID=A0A221ME33_9BACI|nr:inositol monophosphatase family protein [Virgibacillus necropolis]ASN05894.1 inositol monophosphatase [Virgibacillus necropolis]